MTKPLASVLVSVTLTLAYRTSIPIGMVLDSRQAEVETTLRWLVDVYNKDESNIIQLNPTWAIVDMDNSCDIINAICRCLDAGVYLFLGSSTSRTYNIIQSYSHALRVPYVTFMQTTNHERDEYRYDVSISPNYMTALVDVIKFFKWRKIYYVFDTDDALWELQRLHDAFRSPEFDLTIDTRRIRNVSFAHEFLRHLDRFSSRTETKRIVLNLSSKETYQVILNQIVDVGMNRANYHYLLSGPYMDSLDLHSFLYGGVNLTGFRLPIERPDQNPHPPVSPQAWSTDFSSFASFSTQP